MTKMIDDEADRSQDTSAGDADPKWDHLPELDLPEWLAAITPRAAPALALTPEGAFVFGPMPIPISRPELLVGARPRRLDATLGLLSIGGRPLHRDAVRNLSGLLGGPGRADGLPGWNRAEADRRHHRFAAWAFERKPPLPADRELSERHARETRFAHESGGEVIVRVSSIRSTAAPLRNDRSVVRDVHTAVSLDLAAGRRERLSALYGLADHVSLDDRFRQIGRGRARGRWVLSLLGIWPWTHVERGVLPDDWRADSRFHQPLIAWHREALRELREEIEVAERRFRSTSGP